MDYLWLKALHVAAVVTWIGGMLAMTIAARNLPAERAGSRNQVIAGLRRWDRRITSPAMGLAWILGLALAVMGGWYSAIWFMLKFAIVFLLSALHGMQGGALRRMETDETLPAPAVLRRAPAIILAAVLTIAILVIVKPLQ